MGYIKAFFLFVMFHTISGRLGFDDCGRYTIEDVRLTGCEKTPCIIKAGTKPTIEIDFKTGDDTKSKQLNTEVDSSVFNLRFPLDFNLENACGQVGCPLDSNNLTGTLRAVLDFDNDYVNAAVTALNGTGGDIFWVTRNEKKKKVVCFEMRTTFIAN